MSSDTANLNGITISYTIQGNPTDLSDRKSRKPWIVLINGLADNKESWLYQIPALINSGHPILTFDNRGIGQSSAPGGPYTASLLASDTRALIRHLNIELFHLVGVSMGGMICQQLALDNPDGIVSLTLACTYAAPSLFCRRMFEFWADTARVMGVPHVMRDVLLWCFTQDFYANRHDELVGFEDAMRSMEMPVHAYLAQLHVIQHFDTTGELNGLPKVPVLVMAGEEDILIPTALSRELHRLIPGSTWCAIKGGHGANWEYPDGFNRALLEFITRTNTV